MNKNLKIAIDFTTKIKNKKGLLQIILFGSVARGEDKIDSDIDIAIIYENIDKYKFRSELNLHKHEKIQLTLIDIKNLADETEISGALSGDGLLLHGSPIKFKIENLDLNPKILISYSLTNIPQTEKVKLNRALHGSVSKSESNGKIYKTETQGLINEPGIEKISNGVILADRRKATKIINVLKRFKANIKEVSIWSY